MLKKILLGVAAIAVLFVLYVAVQPSEFTITRSATISAPPQVVFTQVNDLHRWQAWSPWANKDPNAKATFAGPTAGEGSSFTWSGNDEIGEGTMTIVESQPSKLVRIKLDFVRPMEATNFSEFNLQPQEEGTEVVWSMSGENNFLGRLICTFMDMDAMVGSDFEKGLAQLKSVSEASAEDATSDEVSDEASEASATTADPAT